jgi:hypothetical protein
LHFAFCILQFFLRVLCVLCGYLFFAAVGSAAPQLVAPVDGEAFEGELVSIGGDGKLTFRVPQSTVAEATAPSDRELRMEELVRWGHPVTFKPQTVVVLADDGQLVTAADWAGGAAVRLEGDAVVVLSDTFDEERLPREAVRGVVFAQRRHATEREALVARVQGNDSAGQALDGSQDVLFLSNGDRLVGNLIELGRGSLRMATDAGEAKLPLSRVDAVKLGGGQPSAVSHQAETAVSLRDGSMLYANAVRGDEKHLEVELSNEVKLGGGSVAEVAGLQSLRGRFVYLSDREATAYRHVPYLDMEWVHERDRNVLGTPLVVAGNRYLKGIGMHSASRLTYRLDGAYQRFDASIAIDDSADGRGSVTFGVYVSREGEWQQAYASGIVRGGAKPQAVSIDLVGAAGLTLTVDYADRGDELDRADWLDARLVKGEM